MRSIALTVFQGRAGDHNDLAIPGAASVGLALSDELDQMPVIIGTPEAAMNADWGLELAAARHTLEKMSEHYDRVLSNGHLPVTALTRCAVALATLPVVAKYRPDAVVVWFDAHADLNTPETSTTGYLGGMAISGAAGLWRSGLGAALNLTNVILVGVRDVDLAEQKLIDRGLVRAIPVNDDLKQALKSAISDRPVYIHLDCDVLNPGIVPTDYQVEGGLSLASLHDAMKILAQNEIVGFEIAEFENAWEVDGPPVSPRELLDAVRPLIEQALTQRCRDGLIG
ncbi:arginase family protein [Agrobacterium tumefaciens]